MYQVTKTYGHNLGLSACFRQWKASSHCRFFHGYALEVKLTFEAEELNELNWCIDFGSLKPIKQFLVDNFDHKTVVAEDDPALETFKQLWAANLVDLVIIPFVGCEGFAKYIADNVEDILAMADVQGDTDNGVFLKSVEVREHGANSAIYFPD